MVIHLSAPAAADAAGNVFLLPADPGGDSPRNRLTLAELLAAVRDCPARHKLLVLNLTPPAEDPLVAPAPGNLSAAAPPRPTLALENAYATRLMPSVAFDVHTISSAPAPTKAATVARASSYSSVALAARVWAPRCTAAFVVSR